MTKRRTVVALVAVLAALVICAGIALAAASVRTINVNFYEPLELGVSPSLDVDLDVPYAGSNYTTYTISNPTPQALTVTCSVGTLPTGVSVGFSPLTFSLAAGASQEVTVTVTNTSGTPPDCAVTLSFTPS